MDLTWWSSADDDTVERMALYEAGFTLRREFANPYDPDQVTVDAHITLPDGAAQQIPLFWRQGYTRALVKGAEILRHCGAPEWRLRFTPRQVGNYSYEIIVREDGAASHFGPFGFAATPSHDPGFLRRSADPAYLEFDNGAFFFGVGHNLCGWEWGGTDNRQGTFEYDEWLLGLAENGANMAQFDFCEGDQIEWTHHPTELPFSADWAGLVRYNQQTAWKMDQRLRRAAELGIYARLSLLHWEDFDHEAENFPDWGWNRNPYNSANGGPIATAGQFFSDERARAIFKKQLRYIVARWGYAPHILAFELWNEVDAPWIIWGEGESYQSHEAAIVSWHQEMAAYLRQIDPNRHLITSSFERSDHGAGLWALDEIDFSTFHRYTYYNPDYGDSQFATVATLGKLIAGRLHDTAKPVLGGEFALSPGGDIQKERDPEGVAFHQQIWASAMLKSLGTAMHWTWGSYIHAKRLYHHYRPLSRFLADEDLRGMVPFDNLSSGAAVEHLGLRAADRALLWVRDPRYDFGADTSAKPLPGQQITVAGLRPGEYLISVYDPWTGDLRDHRHATIDGDLLIDLPGFARDLAVKVQLRGSCIEWISKDIGMTKAASATDIVGRGVAITASGVGIGGTADQFRFVYVPVADDFTLEARFDALTNLGEFVRAGLMARVGDTPAAPFAYLASGPTGIAEWRNREGVAGVADGGFYWRYRLQRRGTSISGAVSPDGVSWVEIGSTIIAGWPETLLVGLAAASKDDFTYVQARFSAVRLLTTQQ